MKGATHLLLAAAFSLGLAASAFGQISYTGDLSGVPASANTIGGTRAFDDVKVLDQYVTQVWANMGQFGGDLSGITAYEYQFRTGMGFQNAGTLVASGVVTDFVKTPTGRDFGLPDLEYQILLNVAVQLAPGTYFLSIAAVADANANVFVSGTEGFDFDPSTDPNPAPQNNILNNNHWDLFNSGSGGADASQGDLSYGVLASPVPEPSLLALVGAGALAIARRRRKQA